MSRWRGSPEPQHGRHLAQRRSAGRSACRSARRRPPRNPTARRASGSGSRRASSASPWRHSATAAARTHRRPRCCRGSGTRGRRATPCGRGSPAREPAGCDAKRLWAQPPTAASEGSGPSSGRHASNVFQRRPQSLALLSPHEPAARARQAPTTTCASCSTHAKPHPTCATPLPSSRRQWSSSVQATRATRPRSSEPRPQSRRSVPCATAPGTKLPASSDCRDRNASAPGR
mmetsp:Transcript_52638/g.133605  ORF Transcript_52638/g.133605 Transcript_52638/m.133605 type:complete len:231 (-) Transcript_52638:220-912(-)